MENRKRATLKRESCKSATKKREHLKMTVLKNVKTEEGQFETDDFEKG